MYLNNLTNPITIFFVVEKLITFHAVLVYVTGPIKIFNLDGCVSIAYIVRCLRHLVAK